MVKSASCLIEIRQPIVLVEYWRKEGSALEARAAGLFVHKSLKIFLSFYNQGFKETTIFFLSGSSHQSKVYKNIHRRDNDNEAEIWKLFLFHPNIRSKYSTTFTSDCLQNSAPGEDIQ